MDEKGHSTLTFSRFFADTVCLIACLLLLTSKYWTSVNVCHSFIPWVTTMLDKSVREHRFYAWIRFLWTLEVTQKSKEKLVSVHAKIKVTGIIMLWSKHRLSKPKHMRKKRLECSACRLKDIATLKAACCRMAVTTSVFPNRNTFAQGDEYCTLFHKLRSTCGTQKRSTLNSRYPNLCQLIEKKANLSNFKCNKHSPGQALKFNKNVMIPSSGLSVLFEISFFAPIFNTWLSLFSLKICMSKRGVQKLWMVWDEAGPFLIKKLVMQSVEPISIIVVHRPIFQGEGIYSLYSKGITIYRTTNCKRLKGKWHLAY